MGKGVFIAIVLSAVRVIVIGTVVVYLGYLSLDNLIDYSETYSGIQVTVSSGYNGHSDDDIEQPFFIVIGEIRFNPEKRHLFINDGELALFAIPGQINSPIVDFKKSTIYLNGNWQTVFIKKANNKVYVFDTTKDYQKFVLRTE